MPFHVKSCNLFYRFVVRYFFSLLSEWSGKMLLTTNVYISLELEFNLYILSTINIVIMYTVYEITLMTIDDVLSIRTTGKREP